MKQPNQAVRRKSAKMSGKRRCPTSLGGAITRTQKVRDVFHELRRLTCGSVAAGKLLDCANQLVEAFHGEDDPHFDLRLGGRPFVEWSLDAVFADGGWRVLDRYHVERFDGNEGAVNDPLLVGKYQEMGLEISG